MEKIKALKISDPITSLGDWIEEARQAGVPEPGAMTLSTVSTEGQPSSRVVLLKDLNEDGISFYTNMGSRKSNELRANPKVALNFSWLPLGKQVCIIGTSKELTREQSIAYWETRPKESQVSQHLSKQSHPLESRRQLEQSYQDALKEFADKAVPCPKTWGGYLVTLTSIEFWLAHPYRLHDRLLCKKVQNLWDFTRLHP